MVHKTASEEEEEDDDDEEEDARSASYCQPRVLVYARIMVRKQPNKLSNRKMRSANDSIKS